MENSRKRYKILNTYVNALSMQETIQEVEKIVEKGVPVQHVVINALKVNLMEENPQLRRIVNKSPLINADGASILWAAKLFHIPLSGGSASTIPPALQKHRRLHPNPAPATEGLPSASGHSFPGCAGDPDPPCAAKGFLPGCGP